MAAIPEPPSNAAKLAEPAATDSASAKGKAPTFSPLSHLTGQSARFGRWEVVIFNPTARTREYLWQGKQRTAYNFQCMLVSTADPTLYVLGDSHGKGMTEATLKNMADKFKPGLVFEMSKVVFADNVKTQYNSAPKMEVVSMLNTSWNPVLASAGKPRMPEPAIPVAESMGIEHEQHFDTLALIQKVSEMSAGGLTSTGQGRVRCTIVLNDGSKNKMNDKVCHLPVTVFADARMTGEPPMLFSQLSQAADDKTAMAFFGIQGKQSDRGDGTWSFTSNFTFHCQSASETTKGKMLEANASVLRQADAEAVPQSVLQSQTSRDNDETFANVEATETTCALFRTIMADTKLKVIETDITMWQINWCHVHPPDQTAQVCTNDSVRLWMQVKVEDETGNLSLFMREKAALSLSSTASKEDFEAARADDSLDFPKKASIKIIRKPPLPETPTAASSAEKSARIQCYIVEAAEQAMEDTPSKRSLTLLNLLEHTEACTDACVPAGIGMIRKDPHYGLAVSYVVEQLIIKKRCTRAVALVIATSASKSDNLNEGYQMVTENVKDALDESFQCTLISFCTVRASPDYQLKPARGQKTQTAFVVIADVLEPGSAEKPPVFLVEFLERIPDTEAMVAPEHMRRLIHFASLTAKMQGSNPQKEWTEETSPANAGKCRRLGKSPTDDLLEQYNPSH